MYQQITLIGHLGADPELRYTPDGTPVCNFRLAVHKHWVGGDGEKADKTTWFRVTSWRRQAEMANEYLTKGRTVLVVGTVEQPQVYVNRAGEPAASLEVTANVVRFLSNDSAAKAMEDASQHDHEDGNQPVGEMDIPF